MRERQKQLNPGREVIRRLSLLLFFTFIFCQGIFAQNPNTKQDSLLAVLQEHPADTIGVLALNELFKLNFSKNLELALQYERRALDISMQIGYPNGIRKCTNNMGAAYTYLGKYQEALRYHRRFLEMELERNDRAGIATAHNNIGSDYYSLGEYANAIDHYRKSLIINQSLGDTARALGAINNIGSCLLEMGNYPEALKKFIEAIVGYEALGDERGLVEPLSNAGNVLLNQRHDKEALQYFQRAMDICEKQGNNFGIISGYANFGSIYQDREDYPKATEYFEKAYQLSIEVGAQYRAALALSRLAEIDLLSANRSALTRDRLEEALRIFNETEGAKGEANALHTLGIYYLEEGEYRKAIDYLNQSLSLSREIDAEATLLDVYLDLGKAWAKLGNFQKAYEYEKEYVAFNDSLSTKEKSRQMAEMQQKYEAEKREKEIGELERERVQYQLDILTKNKERTLLIAGLAVVLLLAMFFFVLLRQKVRSGKVIERVNKALQEQKALVEAQNKKIKEINVGLERVVAERTQNLVELNKELDGFLYESAHALRRPITSIRGLRDLLQSEQDPEVRKDLSEKIEYTMERMDQMLFKLIMVNENNRRPLNIETVFLEEELQGQAAVSEGKEGTISIQCPADLKVNTDAWRLKLILQSILENAIDFAQKTAQQQARVQVKAHMSDDHLMLSIEDNGQGMRPEIVQNAFDMFFRGNEISQGNGLGLYLAKKLVEKLQGSIEIESQLGQYTRFILKVPNAEGRP